MILRDRPRYGKGIALEPAHGLLDERVAARDPRSRAWPVAGYLDDRASATVTTRLWPTPLQLNQGSTPRCVGYSLAQTVAADPHHRPASKATADFIYERAEATDGLLPDTGGTTLAAGLEVCRFFGAVTAYRWCFGGEPEVRGAVLNIAPVNIAIPWPDSMNYPNAFGFVVPKGPTGGVGWHAIEVCGYDEHGFYWLHNTWGARWGSTYPFHGRGFAALLASDLARLLDMGGQAAVVTKE